uniref:Uncharacterized protein n=1 Tax=Caenorhabditis japonica TaxID=281687 RepID=A0A8R1DIG4_CAEJA
MPGEFHSFSQPGDIFTSSIWHEGRRYSSLRTNFSDDRNVEYLDGIMSRFGKVCGFFMDRDQSNIRAIIEPYKITNQHLLSLTSLLMQEGLPRDHCQTILDSLYDSQFGSIFTAKQPHTVIDVKFIVGHAIVVNTNSTPVVLPVSTRPAPS